MQDKAGYISPELAVVFGELREMWLLPTMCLIRKENKNINIKVDILYSLPYTFILFG
jgi:hypothetical protein